MPRPSLARHFQCRGHAASEAANGGLCSFHNWQTCLILYMLAAKLRAKRLMEVWTSSTNKKLASSYTCLVGEQCRGQASRDAANAAAKLRAPANGGLCLLRK